MTVDLPAPDGPTRAVVRPGSAVKLDLVEHGSAAAVAERDVPKLDAAARDLQFRRIRRVGLVRLGVEDLVDHPGVHHGPLHRHLQAGELARRIVGEKQRRDEGEEGARKNAAIDGVVGGIGEHARDRDAGQRLGQRRGALGQVDDAVRLLLRRNDQLLDARSQLRLHREGLDDRDALHGFLHRTEDLAVDDHRFPRRAAQALGDVAQGVEDGRSDEECEGREERVALDHHADERDQRQYVACQRGHGEVHHVPDARNVLADLRRDLRRAGLAEIADAELHQVLVEPPLVSGDQVVSDPREGDRLSVGGHAAQHEGYQYRQADDPDEIGPLLGEGLVDHVLHDPGGERRRPGDDGKADDREGVCLHVVPAVLRYDPLQNAEQGIGVYPPLFLASSEQSHRPGRTSAAIHSVEWAL